MIPLNSKQNNYNKTLIVSRFISHIPSTRYKQRYAEQTIYGISFEIGNTIQKVYYDSFKTQVYFNTEEDYQENIEDCEKEEESYFHNMICF